MPLVRSAVDEGGVFGQAIIVIDDKSQVGHRFTAFIGHREWIAGFVISGIDVRDPARRREIFSKGWREG